MKYIQPEMSIEEIITKYPETLEIFVFHGFEQFIDNKVLREVGGLLKLKTALKIKQINEELFIKSLERKIDETNLQNRKTFIEEYEQEGLNLLGLLPCPLKVPVEEKFKSFIEGKGEGQENSLQYLIESHANQHSTYYEYIRQVEDIDELPDIIISPGFNSFFYRDFVQKFIETGLFVDMGEVEVSQPFESLHYKDPNGHYTMLAMNLSVMVVDHTQLGDLPVPQKWEDLLHPDFHKKVVIRGQRWTFCETVLMSFYKDFGMEGVRKLGKAVKAGWHPSEMVKQAGTGKAGAPVVSVMPYFYANTIKNKEEVSVIWPEDGALVNPVTMLVKASKREELKEIIDFFTGPEVGRVCAEAYFPSTHPKVDNKLAEGASFKWLGWDFVQQHDLGKLVEELNKEFLQAFKGEEA